MVAKQSHSADTILVVDDNPQNRALLEAQLSKSGYAVTTADSGQQALSQFGEHAFDLVLLDIRMPGMDGFEACRRLRGLPGGADTPILFVTALDDLGTLQTAMESGADDFLTKPVNRTELFLRVKSLLRIRRMSLEIQDSRDLIAAQLNALLAVQQQKEELTELVVHDLKGPLAIIQANGQILVDQPGLPPRILEGLTDIVSAAEAMHRMVMNLLDISRSEEGSLSPKCTDFDLGVLIEGVCGGMKRRLEERRIRLELAVAPCRIHADADLLRRLVENLLDNSLKYGPAGGAVRVGTNICSDQSLEIRMIDEGPGVPGDFREKIFDKYVQLDRGVDNQLRTSRGLGLTFCRLAVEAHGGRIWVEDNWPQGSVFCVVLPATAVQHS